MNTELGKMEQLHGDLRMVLGTSEDHCDDVFELMVVADRLHRAKENTYNRSFARRGLIGIWHNVARKYDVVDNLGRKDAYIMAMVDALFDVAVYAFKLILAIRLLKPDVYDEWYTDVYEKFVEANGND